MQSCEILLWQAELGMPSSSKPDWRPCFQIFRQAHCNTVEIPLFKTLSALDSHMFTPEGRKAWQCNFYSKFLFLWNIACLQIGGRGVQRGCLPSHKEDSMYFTNSKQSWYVQTHKGIDCSGWQRETSSLETNLAAGQEIRSRVALCILIHVSESMLKQIDSWRVSSLPWHSVDTLLNSMLANTYTALRVGSQGACPKCSTVWRLLKLSSADLKKIIIQEDLDDLTHACWSNCSFHPELNTSALQRKLVLRYLSHLGAQGRSTWAVNLLLQGMTQA